MSHTTPATYLIWSAISCLLGMFLTYHLWKFDKFKCLRWNNGPHSGAFKRLMTYTYLLSVPCVIAYSTGFAIIKYQEGFVDLPFYGIVPKPWQMWSEAHKAAILPLYLTFTISWSLEMVTHLEELCFWLFLVNSSTVKQDWFQSMYFKTWAAGSIIAVFYMPLVTIFTRADPLKCEAFTFLAGSLGSLSLTLWFMPILWNFPSFIKRLQSSGVDKQTIVRLMSFHEFNCIRVVFRFLFVLPLLILAADGIRPHYHVNGSTFGTEFLTAVAAIGCGLSSALTLVIFFPRSVEAELRSQSRHALREKFHARFTRSTSQYTASEHGAGGGKAASLLTAGSVSEAYGQVLPFSPRIAHLELDEVYSPTKCTSPESAAEGGGLSPMFSPNRRAASGGVIEGRVLQSPTPTYLTAREDSGAGGVHPFLHNFTSPIDIVEGIPRRVYARRQHAV